MLWYLKGNICAYTRFCTVTIHVDGRDLASANWVKTDILILKHLQLAIRVDPCQKKNSQL